MEYAIVRRLGSLPPGASAHLVQDLASVLKYPLTVVNNFYFVVRSCDASARSKDVLIPCWSYPPSHEETATQRAGTGVFFNAFKMRTWSAAVLEYLFGTR
jgi:hypothetical protein